MFLQLSLLASLKSSRASSCFSLVTTLVVWVAPTTLRQMWRSEKTQEYKVTKWNYSHREFLKLVFYPKTEVELASSPGLHAKPKIHTRTTERSASNCVTSSVASTYVTTKYILMLNSLYYHVQPAYNQWNASALKWQTRSPLHIWIFLDIVTSRAGTCGGCDCADHETQPLLPKTPSVSAASPTHVMARTGMCTFTLQLTPLIYDTCIYVLYLCMHGYTDRVCSSTMYAVVNFPPTPHRCDRKKRPWSQSAKCHQSITDHNSPLSLSVWFGGSCAKYPSIFYNTDKYWNVILYKVAPNTFCWPLVTIIYSFVFF